MRLNNDYVKSENTKKLLEIVLLSIKSSEKLGLREDKFSKDEIIHTIETHRIDIERDKRDFINGFYVKITRTNKNSLFRKRYEYEIQIECKKGSYDEYELKTKEQQGIIKEIYDFLIDIENNRKIEEANNTLEKIIGDISTTVETSVKRDEKLDELLND